MINEREHPLQLRLAHAGSGKVLLDSLPVAL